MFSPKCQATNIPREPRLDPTVSMTDEIKQGRHVMQQLNHGLPYGDTRSFPAPEGAVVAGYPSTATTVPSLGQPIKTR